MTPAQFLRHIWWPQGSAWFCVSTKSPSGRWRDHFFRPPFGELHEFITEHGDRSLYFCPTPLTTDSRRKEKVKGSCWLWADLDAADPRRIEPRPTIAWQTSPGRYAALWRVLGRRQPARIENANRALAYRIGADKSGWDLSQVLRLPHTRNYKYDGAPKGKLLWIDGPTLAELPKLARVKPRRPVAVKGCRPRAKLMKLLKPSTRAFLRYPESRIHDRSAMLCKLVLDMHEAGLSEAEILKLLKPLPYNKFRGRPNEDEMLLAPLRRA
jgi:hypothetical protein